MAIRYIVSLLTGYLFGNIESAYFVGKAKKIDVRRKGSGNLGAANTFRILGTGAGLLVFAGDCVKAALATLVGLWIAGRTGAIIGGFGAILGHNWPVFLGFRGGKGIAATFGMTLVLAPVIAGVLALVFLLVVLVSRVMSLGSMIGVCLLPVLVAVCLPGDTVFLVASIVMAVMALFRHRENIKRLMTRSENKIEWGRKKDTEKDDAVNK
jgi:glycerol-3-phosphate acyltransferase PlsY